MKTAGNDHIALLIELYLDGECNPAERKALEDAIADDPALQLEMQQAQAVRRAFERDVNMLKLPGADKEHFLAKVAASAGGIGESITASAGAAAALGLSVSGNLDSAGSAASPSGADSAGQAASGSVPAPDPVLSGGAAASGAGTGTSTAGILGGSGTAWMTGVVAAVLLAVGGFLAWNPTDDLPEAATSIEEPLTGSSGAINIQPQPESTPHIDAIADQAIDMHDAGADVQSAQTDGDGTASAATADARVAGASNGNTATDVANANAESLNGPMSAPLTGVSDFIALDAAAAERFEPALITSSSFFDFDRTFHSERDILDLVLLKLTTVPESPRWSLWASGGYLLALTEATPATINPDYSFGLQFKVNEELSLALQAGNENIAQSVLNGGFFTTEDRYSYGVAGLIYLPRNLRFERVEPYVQIMGGMHSSGFVVKSRLGVQRPLMGPFRAHISIEGTGFRGSWQDIGKAAIVSGIGFTF